MAERTGPTASPASAPRATPPSGAPGADPPSLSVVVPTLNEAHAVGLVLADVAELGVPHEVIVVDGGSADDTVAVAAALGARVLHAPAGRGAQLASGAAAARGAWLAFLHADARLGTAARQAIERVTASDQTGHAYAFTFAVGAPGARYRVLEWGTNVRARVAKLPYGDQGLLMNRRDYDRSGGYQPHPIMEDVALLARIRRIASVHLLDAPLTVSPRRWQRTGVVRGTLRNWALITAYWCGVPPSRLARAYRPASGDSPRGSR